MNDAQCTSSEIYGGPARNIDFELLDSVERPVPDNCGYITVEGRSVSDALADAMCAAAYTAGQILEAMNRLAEILNNMLPSVAEAMQHIEDFFKEITNADPAWIEKIPIFTNGEKASGGSSAEADHKRTEQNTGTAAGTYRQNAEGQEAGKVRPDPPQKPGGL